MPQSALFTFATPEAAPVPEVTPTPAPTPEVAPAPTPEPSGTEQSLKAIQAKLDAITAGTKVDPPAPAPKTAPKLNWDPSKLANTDENVIKDIEAGIVNPLNEALATLASTTQTPIPVPDTGRMDRIESLLTGVTTTLANQATQTAKAEAERSKIDFRNKLSTEFGDVGAIIADPAFQQYMTQPIVEGSHITIGNMLAASEKNLEAETIAGYIRTFKASQPNPTGGHPPIAPSTIPKSAEVGGETTTSAAEIRSMRADLRKGGNPAEIAARLKTIKLF